MIAIRARYRLLALLAASAPLLGTPAAAQEPRGRIDVVVREDDGARPLRGATVKAVGVQDETAVTDSHGEAHFVDLPPGEYLVIATLSGYNEYHSLNVPVATGTAVLLNIWMSVASPMRQVDTRIDAPPVDTRAHTVATAVSFDELQRVPWNRDPWTILQTVPTVIVDRVNVAGADSGQQFTFEAKGAAPSDNTWALDGVPTTDMSAPGSSATYVDFGMLYDLRVTTGGASPRVATPGAQTNVVLQSGGNEWRGSGRAYVGHNRMQANNVSRSMRPQMDSYARAGDYRDVGVEGGGPILKERILGWAGAGRTRPERRIFSSGPTDADDDETARDSTTLAGIAAKATGIIDRDTRATVAYFRHHKDERGYGASATRPQDSVFDEDASTTLFKAGIDRRAGHDVFLSGKYARIDGGFTLTPRRTGFQYTTDRPQDYAALDAYLFSRSHQLAFGAGWRSVRDRSSFAPDSEGDYASAYAADTIAWPRLTLALSARWDRARSSTRDGEIIWNSLTPRVGATYVVDDDRTTLVRASYSILPSQLAATAVNELRATIGNYVTPLTHEIAFGGDRYLVSSDMTVSALFTWRYMSRWNWVHHRGVTADDYTPAGRFTGSAAPIGAFDVPLYQVDPFAVPPGLERIYERRNGYHQRYWGIEVAASKRFLNNWALRMGFSTNDHREYFDSPNAIADPTPTLESPNVNGGMVMRRVDAPGVTGVFMLAPKYQFAGTASYRMFRGLEIALDYVMRQGYAAPFYASDAPGGNDLLAPGGRNLLLVADPGRGRLSMAHSLDGRVSKGFVTGGVHVFELHLDVDVFNIFNRSIVLARGYDLSRADFNRILAVTPPRAIRLGVRAIF